MRLLTVVQRLAFGNPVPLGQTTAATRCRSVLADENGVATVWRLLAIILWVRRRETCRDEIGSVTHDSLEPVLSQIGCVRFIQLEFPTKCGA